MKFWPAKLAITTLGLSAIIFSQVVLAGTQDFTFDSFSADYSLRRSTNDKTPALIVTETLVARFPYFDQNHGILRAIPERYQGHTLSLNILSVTDENGQPYPYATSHQNNNRVLKIGDAKKFVHGIHTYKLNYQMRNVINYQSDHDEFYWNINGDQWPQPFGKVEASVHVPSDFETNLQQRQTCYAGASGENSVGCTINRRAEAGGTLVTAAASNLQPYQTLSVVLAFDKGTFMPGPEIAQEQRVQKIEAGLAAAGIALPPLIAFWLMFGRWRRFGNDPKGRGVIIPQYEPPKSFDVLSSDFILQEKLRGVAFSAMLIEQATKRQLKVYEIPKEGLFGPKDYELELKKVSSDLSLEAEQGLRLIFGSDLPTGERIKLSDFKKSATQMAAMFNGMKKIEKALSLRLASAGYFIKDPRKIKTGYQAWACLPFFGGFGLTWVSVALSFFPLAALGGGLIAAGAVMISFSFIMPARSETGVEANDDLLGLKDYIKMAEADRLKYLQSPEGAEKVADDASFNPTTDAAKVKLFEKLLPYAMLFGLEKGWAKQFKDLYTKPPDWYQGNAAAFNIGYLGSSLSDFSKSTGQVFAASSSPGGSGFGGGAGGRGGGGGGGGW